MKKIIKLSFIIVVIQGIILYSFGGQSKPFSVKQLKEDFNQLRTALEKTHPLLYEFTEKKEFNRLFEKQANKIISPMPVNEFYRLLLPLVEKVGCGHTNVWMPKGWLSQPGAQYFPLKLIFLDNKAYVLDKQQIIPQGSQILSINGKLIKDIIECITNVISADGYNYSYKVKRMEKMFPFQFAKRFGFSEKFIVHYVPAKEKKIVKVILSFADFQTARQNIIRNPTLESEIRKEKKTAILTINNFSYYRNKKEFFDFIDISFSKILNEGVKNIILDLRGNDGGDPFCAAYLLSHLASKPIPYFSKPYGKYRELALPIPLAKNRFKKNLYLLIDGMCFSTTGHLCGLLKFHKIGSFIGSETGGTYTCNDAKKFIDLKNTKIQLWVASGSFAVAVKGLQNDEGIQPDFLVKTTIDDIVNGKDAIKDFTIGLINKK